jgi:hypothetical protein
MANVVRVRSVTMSPTVRVDEEVYRALQGRAEPFVDTPNSVLRRLLDLGNAESSEAESVSPERERPRSEVKASRKKAERRRKKRTRAPSGTLLRQEEYELPLLQVLIDLGGSAAAGEVIELLGERLNENLKPADRERLDSGAVRWENRAQFVRFELVQRGDMKKDSPRGVWEISQQGRDRLSEASAA